MNSAEANAVVSAPGAKSRWPARLDVLQSLSGLLLALFMWAHMVLVSSILLGKDAMWVVARLFEGQYLFGTSHPVVVSLIASLILALLVVHALLAVRKFPNGYRQYATFRTHMRDMRHEDTTLWFWQVLTGFALFFMASVHVYGMLVRPDRIGPFASADRVWSEGMWPLYLAMLFAVEVHGGVGLYRIAVKWGWLEGRTPAVSRHRLKMLKWALTVFFLVLGLATLAAYVRIGVAHAPWYGERYVPTWLSPGGGALP